MFNFALRAAMMAALFIFATAAAQPKTSAAGEVI